MKKNKEIKSSTIKYINEDTNEVRKFIFILLGVSLIVVLLYFLTAKYLVKDGFQDESKSAEEAAIDYTSLNVGEIFNRPYDEYYVFAYDTTETEAIYYRTLKDNFKDKHIYLLDLSKDINSKYLGNSNKNATTDSEISLVNPTLILIKDKKIAKYYDQISDIEKELK